MVFEKITCDMIQQTFTCLTICLGLTLVAAVPSEIGVAATKPPTTGDGPLCRRPDAALPTNGKLLALIDCVHAVSINQQALSERMTLLEQRISVELPDYSALTDVLTEPDSDDDDIPESLPPVGEEPWTRKPVPVSNRPSLLYRILGIESSSEILPVIALIVVSSGVVLMVGMGVSVIASVFKQPVIVALVVLVVVAVGVFNLYTRVMPLLIGFSAVDVFR
ncbi:uncharacterized protein LOC129595683 [Paramacrobiotus metropolitanus]|uniref:uncharacterized protein LOC129595683 n=1 Tax=Paramacrobiotus metropolitanus TaxID=2943436 RepID=UPI0024462660|nr:uncharacterized protein LOC129595683 [Paramacrobiotus metropolitanus]